MGMSKQKNLFWKLSLKRRRERTHRTQQGAPQAEAHICNTAANIRSHVRKIPDICYQYRIQILIMDQEIPFCKRTAILTALKTNSYEMNCY